MISIWKKSAKFGTKISLISRDLPKQQRSVFGMSFKKQKNGTQHISFKDILISKEKRRGAHNMLALTDLWILPPQFCRPLLEARKLQESLRPVKFRSTKNAVVAHSMSLLFYYCYRPSHFIIAPSAISHLSAIFRVVPQRWRSGGQFDRRRRL